MGVTRVGVTRVGVTVRLGQAREGGCRWDCKARPSGEGGTVRRGWLGVRVGVREGGCEGGRMQVGLKGQECSLTCRSSLSACFLRVLYLFSSAELSSPWSSFSVWSLVSSP